MGEQTATLLALAAAGPISTSQFWGEWVIHLNPGSSQSLAAAVGALSTDVSSLIPNTYLWQFASGTPTGQLQAVAATRDVGWYYPLVSQVPLQRVSRFIPNDPSFSQQWHLQNTGQAGGTPGNDINIVNAWNVATGSGVQIGIVDTGQDFTHPDLAPNHWTNPGEIPNNGIDDDGNGLVDDVDGWDFVSNDNNPSPGPGEDHGTAVAGTAAARGNNSLGVVGSAFDAQIVSIRGGTLNDAADAAALSYMRQVVDIYYASWGPLDNGMNLTAPGPLTRAAMQAAVTSGRGGLGNIYTWAAGNGRTFNDNVNYDGFANSRFVIAVAALNNNGAQASYSEPGAPILVTAPGGD